MNRLKQLWSNLRSSLWFVPVLIVVCSVGLAVGFIEVDGRINRELLAEYPRIFGAGAPRSASSPPIRKRRNRIGVRS